MPIGISQNILAHAKEYSKQAVGEVKGLEPVAI